MIVVIVLVLAALSALAVLLWRALERDEAPEPRDRGVLAVDLRDRLPDDER